MEELEISFYMKKRKTKNLLSKKRTHKHTQTTHTHTHVYKEMLVYHMK